MRKTKFNEVVKSYLHSIYGDNLNEIWGTEVTVYYPGLYAGQTDLVGVYDGKAAIVDFKGSHRSSI